MSINVSIAEAILGGFKHDTSGGIATTLLAVSIAEAILGGFKQA